MGEDPCQGEGIRQINSDFLEIMIEIDKDEEGRFHDISFRGIPGPDVFCAGDENSENIEVFDLNTGEVLKLVASVNTREGWVTIYQEESPGQLAKHPEFNFITMDGRLHSSPLIPKLKKRYGNFGLRPREKTTDQTS